MLRSIDGKNVEVEKRKIQPSRLNIKIHWFRIYRKNKVKLLR